MVSKSTIGIKSFGVYIPRRRLLRAAIAEAHAWAFPALKGLGKGEKSFCNWDEDAITMAVEAARDALKGFAVADVASLDLASTTAPFADNQNSAVVVAALGAPESISCQDVGGSTRSGLSALIRAFESQVEGDQLVIAAEKRRAKPASMQEMTYGSAAASVLLGQGDEAIATLLGFKSVSKPFFDHFRQQGQVHDYGWEERWIRDEGISKFVTQAVNDLLAEIGHAGSDVAAFGFAGGPLGSGKRLAPQLNINNDAVLSDLQGNVGDTGTAHSLLQLADALENGKAGDLVLLVNFASGCDVVALKINKSPEATGRRGLAGNISRGITDTAYLKLLSHDGEINLDWGMRSESDRKPTLTAMYRHADQVYGFTGGACPSCEAVQFPRLQYCVECGAREPLTPVSLRDEKGAVATFTKDWLMYTPAPPLYVGLVQFDVGARVMMEIVEVGNTEVDIGTPLEMVFRIKERDNKRHFDRYFWKATPLV